jgi:hypothetical protein
MKILLDESVPIQVRHAFQGQDVATVEYLGWKGLENGELLKAAEAGGFETFVVADKNLRYQQNLTDRRLAIVELWTNHRPTLEMHFAYVAAHVTAAKPGGYSIIPAPPAS